jgi:hypothetical protein
MGNVAQQQALCVGEGLKSLRHVVEVAHQPVDIVSASKSVHPGEPGSPLHAHVQPPHGDVARGSAHASNG